MALYLVQHGEACAKDVDSARPLTGQGAADVERMAEFLAAAGMTAGRVIHSGKLRAVQTAERLARRIAPGVGLEAWEGLGPNDDPAAIDWARECGDGNMLAVGHLPFMARLVSLLAAGDVGKHVAAYQPGTVLCLERDDDGRWLIGWMIRPALLQQR